ncbi:Uncharacterised protein [Streptococcus pneumoniae]|nr:Uncharacterised protein [Streptococcus pneumoniae]
MLPIIKSGFKEAIVSTLTCPSSPTTFTSFILSLICGYHGSPVQDFTAPTGFTPNSSKASVPSFVKITTRFGLAGTSVLPIACSTVTTSFLLSSFVDSSLLFDFPQALKSIENASKNTNTVNDFFRMKFIMYPLYVENIFQ